jgi:hypothetical protein
VRLITVQCDPNREPLILWRHKLNIDAGSLIKGSLMRSPDLALFI